MITIVDYGLGNVAAFTNIYKRLDIPARSSRRRAEDLARRDQAHPARRRRVRSRDGAAATAPGMRETLDELVLGERVPVLGICVGMQMLAARQRRRATCRAWAGSTGEVKRFESLRRCAQRTHLPHMGWNDVAAVDADGLFVSSTPTRGSISCIPIYFECDDPAGRRSR